MKTVLVMGSTGSIGKSTLEVLDLHKENFKCIVLSANKNLQALLEKANKYSVKNGLYVGICGITGSVIGCNFVFNISESILNISFGIFLIFVSINMFFTSK